MRKFINLCLSFTLFGYFTVQAQTIDTSILVGNHTLHFKIVRGNDLPILFESGNGDDGSVWEKVLQPLHEATGATLITYDRAGLGKSGIDTLHISFEQEIKDLEYALKKLGYTKDIFLVSHSFGGFYSTLLAHRNKKKIKGAVFIDVALPCFFTKEWSAGFVKTIGAQDWEMIRKYKTGLYYVLKHLEDISGYMLTKPLPGEIPVTLIAAEKILPMVKPNEVNTWTTCLQSFGSLPNHQYVLAKNAGHKVWEDDAELVIREIVKQYKR
jgi:pimeloyl-ACP methyl ester carboxylesterase